MIKAVLYDLGDIFFEAHFWRKWMWEEFSNQGKFNGTFKEFYDRYEAYLLPVYQGKKDYIDAYKDFLKHLQFEHISEIIKRSFSVKETFEKNRILYPGVKDTLRQIYQQGILNIVISDNEAGQEIIRNTILLKFDISPYINKTFTSKELGICKPDPDVFQYILADLKLKRREVIFIAHDKDEIEGALEYGIETIEFNNYLQVPTSAKFKINHFSEIINFI